MKYKVIGRATDFYGGMLGLTKEQAESRSHALKHIKDNIYEVLSPVQFKQGEIVEYDGEVNKMQLEIIEPMVNEVTEIQPEPETKAKAKGKDKK